MALSGTRRCGLCRVSTKTISLTLGFVVANEEPIVRNTILHEIAHAITWEINGTCKHDALWKAVCVKIGCEPERLNNRCTLWAANVNQYGLSLMLAESRSSITSFKENGK